MEEALHIHLHFLCRLLSLKTRSQSQRNVLQCQLFNKQDDDREASMGEVHLREERGLELDHRLDCPE